MRTRIKGFIAIIIVMFLLGSNIPSHGDDIRLKQIITQGEKKQAVLITPEGEKITVEERNGSAVNCCNFSFFIVG